MFVAWYVYYIVCLFILQFVTSEAMSKCVVQVYRKYHYSPHVIIVFEYLCPMCVVAMYKYIVITMLLFNCVRLHSTLMHYVLCHHDACMQPWQIYSCAGTGKLLATDIDLISLSVGAYQCKILHDKWNVYGWWETEQHLIGHLSQIFPQGLYLYGDEEALVLSLLIFV